MNLQLLRNFKEMFSSRISGDDRGIPEDPPGFDGPAVFHEGIGADSADRLRISFHKKTVYDYAHLVPPFPAALQETDRIREQVREALRAAVEEKDSAEESILAFADLLILCGVGVSLDPARPVLDPMEAVELSEKYRKRITLWRRAVEEGAPEDERIRFSKDVYASENEILKVLKNLRDAYVTAANRELDRFTRSLSEEEAGTEAEAEETAGTAFPIADGKALEAAGGNGTSDAEAGGTVVAVAGAAAAGIETPSVESDGPPAAGEDGAVVISEPFPDAAALHEARRRAIASLRAVHGIEEAYIAYKERVLQENAERPHEEHERKTKDSSLETMLQLVQAMNLLSGGSGRQAPDGHAADGGAEKAEKRTIARKLKADGDYGVKDKDRLVQIIYDAEEGGLKFEKDYETLEAMVYRKPQQVALILGQKVDDPVYYK